MMAATVFGHGVGDPERMASSNLLLMDVS